jgi:hypothetical protein
MQASIIKSEVKRVLGLILEQKESVTKKEELLPILKQYIPLIFSSEDIESSRGLLTILGGNNNLPFDVIQEALEQFEKENKQ